LKKALRRSCGGSRFLGTVRSPCKKKFSAVDDGNVDRRNRRRFVCVTTGSLFHNPLANAQSYQQLDLQGGRVLTWPFYAIVKSSLSDAAPLTNLILTWGWILFVLAGFVALLRKDCRQYWSTRPTEILFTVGYIIPPHVQFALGTRQLSPVRHSHSSFCPFGS